MASPGGTSRAGRWVVFVLGLGVGTGACVFGQMAFFFALLSFENVMARAVAIPLGWVWLGLAPSLVLAPAGLFVRRWSRPAAAGLWVAALVGALWGCAAWWEISHQDSAPAAVAAPGTPNAPQRLPR